MRNKKKNITDKAKFNKDKLALNLLWNKDQPSKPNIM